MDLLPMIRIIKGSIESLEQVIEFIETMDDVIYQQAPKPLFDSSIGQHLRHILDLYIALIAPTKPLVIDYDVRRRGITLESVRLEGLKELQQVRTWLLALDPSELTQAVQISTEVSVASVQTIQCDSSFGRELCFASSHLIHHLALMVAIAKYLGQQVSADLGLAPTTATFLRSQQTQIM